MCVLRQTPHRQLLTHLKNANDDETKRNETIKMSEPLRVLNAEKAKGGLPAQNKAR